MCSFFDLIFGATKTTPQNCRLRQHLTSSSWLLIDPHKSDSSPSCRPLIRDANFAYPLMRMIDEGFACLMIDDVTHRVLHRDDFSCLLLMRMIDDVIR